MDTASPAAPTLERRPRLRGEVPVLGDKSISHRALLFGALARGVTRIDGLSTGGDVQSTANCLRNFGIAVEQHGHQTWVTGRDDWQQPVAPLDCGNSGTTLRLMLGALAGRPGLAVALVGDPSLSRRPMLRVAEPLRAMGAHITLSGLDTPPVSVTGQHLMGIHAELPVASAQLKTAVLLAGLRASGETTVREPQQSRDHTERMLQAMGADLTYTNGMWRIRPGHLRPLGDLHVPGDPSSAAFAICAALLHPDAQVTVRHVCLNPTRTGWVRVLQRMGADLEILDSRTLGGEPTGTLLGRSSLLGPTEVLAAEAPGLIDEVPILALCAARAVGTTVFRGVGELRIKESDRLHEIIRLLSALQVHAWASGDDLHVAGQERWAPGDRVDFDPGHDHRMAMSAAVAGLTGPRAVRLSDTSTIDTSWPGFLSAMHALESRPA